MNMQLVITWCLLLLFSNAYAESGSSLKNAQWELGVGATVFNIPLYPGASQNKTYLLPIPHLLYQSKKIAIDNGIQATFLKKQNVRLDISADFGVPVDSKDSTARQGMPDINLTVQLGPSVEITLDGGRFKPSHTRLEFPVRSAFALGDTSIQQVGWIFEPRLTYETRRLHNKGFAYLLSGGLHYSTEKYNDYFYEVAPAFTTSARPAFDAKGGYSGIFVDVVSNLRVGNIIYFAFVRYQNLKGATFVDSPLVEQKDYYFVGVGLTWVFASSRQKSQ